ncbi:MAG: hypothetical protein EOP46_18510 [Sphingobacteriaceae bacterium]|nr:MAG: hypothetical protein EOP46_18510 [Sphingobacteriaceae bacterium]
MNFTDLILLLIVIASIWVSVQRGFILSSLALLTWTGSLAAGFLFYAPLSAILLKIIPSLTIWAPPLAFLTITVLVRFLIDNLSFRLLSTIKPEAHENVINKAAGIIPGAINGLIWAAFFAVFLLLMPFNNSLSKSIREGELAEPLSDKAAWLQGKLSPVFSEALLKVTPKNEVEISKEKSVDLPFSVKAPKTRTDLEAEMLVLVNNERAKLKLKPLKADTAIAVVARLHSRDMFARSYFSHYTPEGLDPFDRMRKGNIRFLTAGENLAIAQTLQMAHKGLMESPGHRANILNPAYGRLGIGVLDGGIYGLMITQNFRN